jgi:hypothetical protein
MTGNTGLRIALDLRGSLFWFTITRGGEQHESSRGYTTASEALSESELYLRLLRIGKRREQDRARRLAENP